MPKNYTESYHLSQWEPDDKVLRTDFNEDNRRIEEALTARAESQAADKSELTSMIALRNCRVECYSYTGDANYNAASRRTIPTSGAAAPLY